MRKFLLFLLFIVLITALVYKSPFSAMYNYNKAKELYANGKYEQSLPYFERSLFADPKGVLARFYYVLALSKSQPTYTVQKNLFEMANSKITDEASKYAKSQVIALRYRLLEGINNNYIFNVPMGDDIVRWDIRSFPLKVFIENSHSIPFYYQTSIDEALNLWTNRTNFVKFQKVNSPQEANIVIRFKDIPEDLCSGNTCTYSVAYTEPDIDKDKVLKKMTLTFYKTNPYKKNFSEMEIYNTALHEIGHTLGIMGHSDNPDDAMFAMKDDTNYTLFKSAYNSLSMTDLKTLALLYRIKPTISDTKDLYSESFYYAPLILGNNDIRLQKKLTEYKNYIKSYPQMSSGYINLSGVYSDLGDYDSAINTLKIALPLASNTDEKYVIYYNFAASYYNKQDYDNALEFANKAKSIKDSQNIRDLISDILKLQNPKR